MNKVLSAVGVAGLVFTLGSAASWGQVPSGNDTSDSAHNTGGGKEALNGTTGSENTAYGETALYTTTGSYNTAVGGLALAYTAGSYNTALGYQALYNTRTAVISDTALGTFALYNLTTGGHNLAVGTKAGLNLTSGDYNIYLGHQGGSSESSTMYLGQGQTRAFIAGVYNVALSSGSPRPVYINSNGQLGVGITSSARYKRDIHEIGEGSQGVYQLRPVTFRYKQDPQGQRQYGLIAEEVAKVYPELVTKGADGKVESVQYHELIPMLLNEVQHQQREIAEFRAQAQQVVELKAQLQEVTELKAQNAALAARLERLEAGAVHPAAVLTH